jgi:hypothetical protein
VFNEILAVDEVNAVAPKWQACVEICDDIHRSVEDNVDVEPSRNSMTPAAQVQGTQWTFFWGGEDVRK